MDEREVDDKISAWHNGSGEGMSLHEYLGMTWEEYGDWIHTDVIPERLRKAEQ